MIRLLLLYSPLNFSPFTFIFLHMIGILTDKGLMLCFIICMKFSYIFILVTKYYNEVVLRELSGLFSGYFFIIFFIRNDIKMLLYQKIPCLYLEINIFKQTMLIILFVALYIFLSKMYVCVYYLYLYIYTFGLYM